MMLVALATLFIKNKAYDKGSVWFRYYFLIATAVELILLVTVEAKINNMIIANVFMLLQFYMLGMGILSWMHQGLMRRMIYFLLNLLSLVIAIYTMGTAHKKMMDSASSSVESIFLMILSALMLMQLTNDNTKYLIRNHKFWFTVAVFLYFSVMGVVIASANFIVDDKTYLRAYTWVINAVMSITVNLLYIKGILCLPAKRISS